MPKTLNNLVDLDKHPNKIENNKLNNQQNNEFIIMKEEMNEYNQERILKEKIRASGTSIMQVNKKKNNNIINKNL